MVLKPALSHKDSCRKIFKQNCAYPLQRAAVLETNDSKQQENSWILQWPSLDRVIEPQRYKIVPVLMLQPF